MSSVLAFVGNPANPVYAGRAWPRKGWLKALPKAVTGPRFIRLGLPWASFYPTNPVCPAAGPVLPPDLWYIMAVLKEHDPAAVVTCGKIPSQAIAAVWQGPLLALPAPMSLAGSNSLYEQAGKLMARAYATRGLLKEVGGVAWLTRLESDAQAPKPPPVPLIVQTNSLHAGT